MSLAMGDALVEAGGGPIVLAGSAGIGAVVDAAGGVAFSSAVFSCFLQPAAARSTSSAAAIGAVPNELSGFITLSLRLAVMALRVDGALARLAAGQRGSPYGFEPWSGGGGLLPWSLPVPLVELAGGIYADIAIDDAVSDGNLVTAPAWPAHPSWLRQFMAVLDAASLLQTDAA